MPKNGWTLLLTGLLLGAFALDVAAASGSFLRGGVRYAIDVWETDDGLPQSSVIAMTQTRDGYLWLGTLNGLVRFDGLRFTVFDEGNTPGLKSSRIVKLFEDSHANLWVGTETAGTALIKDGQVTSPPELALGGPERRLAAACEDATGAVWLYLANGDLWRYTLGRFTPCLAPFLQSQDGRSAWRAIIAEPAGPVWVGTERGQWALDPAAAGTSIEITEERAVPALKLDLLLASRRGGHWRLADGRVEKRSASQRTRDLGPYPWGGARIAAACEDQEGNLLVGTLGAGIFWFDTAGGVSALSTREGLSNDYILSLHMDREGTLWVGTDGGGLNRVKRQVFDVLEPSRGLVVQSVCEDAQAGLWLGWNTSGTDASGLGLWKDGVLRRMGREEGLKSWSVRSVFVDQRQHVWAGTLGGLFQFTNGQFHQRSGPEAILPEVLAIHQDRGGRLWVGTRTGLVRWEERDWKVFRTRDGLSSEVVRAIADDLEGNLWVGTEGGGLNRLREGQFTTFRKSDGLPSDNISALYRDEDGVLWIGTDGGLARWHDGRWTRYTTRDGLVGNSLSYLVEDRQGFLWIGSIAGLMRVPKKALNDFARGSITLIPCRAYGKPDGMPTRECTQGSQPGACRTQDGKLWFPTVKGLAFVDPAQLVPNTNPPPVMIESVLIDGQAQNTNGLRAGWPQVLTIPAGTERVDIHYTSLNLSAPDRARFEYRLEGHETDWTEVGNSRIVRYRKLPPGQYRFEVTACNEDGVWNQVGSAVALMVHPPFWRTWWFLSLSSVSLLGGIIGGVHFFATQKLQRQVENLRQQDALEKERARIARDIHDQLGASLTQVSLLGELVESDKNSPDEVEAHARQISQTARDTTRTLDEIVWTVNPSNDTLEGLINYVCKYAQEYLAVAGVRYRLEVPPQLPNVAILPEVRHNVFLASKEAVTNVVRHAKASAVHIRLRLEPARFTLEIEDNGCGLANMDEKRAQSRNGLRNMRKRMEDMGGSFTMDPALQGGTVVRLSAPFRNV